MIYYCLKCIFSCSLASFALIKICTPTALTGQKWETKKVTNSGYVFQQITFYITFTNQYFHELRCPLQKKIFTIFNSFHCSIKKQRDNVSRFLYCLCQQRHNVCKVETCNTGISKPSNTNSGCKNSVRVTKCIINKNVNFS